MDSLVDDPHFPNLSNYDGPLNSLEIESVFKRLKNYKSPGVDGISNEQLKYGLTGLQDYLVALLRMVWTNEDIPEDWSKGVIIVPPKKCDSSHCGNNRGIRCLFRHIRCLFYKDLELVLTIEALLRENRVHFLWNLLPLDIRETGTLSLFESSLLQYLWKSTVEDSNCDTSEDYFYIDCYD